MDKSHSSCEVPKLVNEGSEIRDPQDCGEENMVSTWQVPDSQGYWTDSVIVV